MVTSVDERPQPGGGPIRAEGLAIGFALRRAVGEDRVRMDRASRTVYSTDASPFHVDPTAIVVAESEEDVRKTLSVCRDLGVPLTPRAAGTSLSGGAIGPGVVLETSGMRRILEFSAAEGWVRVEPGVPLLDLNAFLADAGFFFPLNPGSEDVCRIGGMIGHNASGYRTVKYGQTSDHVLGLRVLLWDGTEVDAHDVALDSSEWRELAIRVPAIDEIRRDIESHSDLIRRARRAVTKHACGYDVFRIASGLERGVFPLQSLFVGSEGTLGVVLEARLRVLRLPVARRTVLLFLDRLEELGPLVQDLLALRPSALESVDGDSMDLLGRSAHAIPASAAAMLLVEFDGEVSDELAGRVAQSIAPRYRLSRTPETASDPERQAELWKIRRGLLPTIYKRPGTRKAWGFVEDAAVPVERVPEFIVFLSELTKRHGTQAAIYGHIGDGNTHFRPLFDPNDPSDLERMKAMRIEFDAAVLDRFGGVPSAEHGIGRLRADILPRIWGQDVYALMHRIKKTLDPEGLLNPGVLIADTPWWASWDRVKTPLPCVTCGKCNAVCPAYAVLQEEDEGARGWFRIANDPGLVYKEARWLLKDCLNCKSCKIVCPADVDVAHEVNVFRRRHPENALNDLYFEAVHTRGRVFRAMTKMLGTTQFLWDRPWARRILAWLSAPNLLSIPTEMILPRLARTTLEERWLDLVHKPGRVAYFPGCAANTMADGTGDAIIRVLQRNGVAVVIPKWVCSGTPMMTYGFAEKVRRLARFNVDMLAGYDAVITGCASCNLSLKEYAELLADDPAYSDRARTLAARVRDISEYVLELPTFKAPPTYVGRKTRVTYHDPCHLRVSEIRAAPREVLRRTSAYEFVEMRNADVCCGGAGTYSMKNRGVSMAHFRRVKEPSVRASGAEVVASSCPACHIQFRDGLRESIPVKHVAVLLDEAYAFGEARSG